MYLTGHIVLLVVAIGYVHACGRPSSVRGPHYDFDRGAIKLFEAKWEFKRSTEHGTKLHHLRAEISPCHFYVYDTDRDGVIIYDEMRALFKDEQVTVAEHLFHELDSTTGDNVITHEEFNLMVPNLIYGCAPDSQDDVPE